MSSPNSKSNSRQNVSKSLQKLDFKKPDGGYGWVILIVAFLISFILDGCMYSFGIVLKEIKNHFQVTQDIVNLVQSLNVGFLFLSGPISSALASQFGCRIVVMGAAAVFGLMYVLCVFMPFIYLIILTFGIIGGVAFGCTYLTCFIILVDYFDKKLGIANGLTMAGSGLGAFAFAPFTDFLIKYFDWKYTMIILGSITLQCCILGALLRPIEHYHKKKKNLTVEMENLNKIENSPEEQNLDLSEPDKKSVGQIVSEIITEMTNFKLLKENIPFLLIALSNFFVFFVYFIPFIYIPIRAQALGITQYPWIISIIGIVNIPVRIIFGFLCDRNFMKAINMNTICTFFASITLFTYYLLLNFASQAAFAVIFAIAIAGMNCLATPYLVDIVGSKKFSNANGILNMFRGFGCIFGPFIGGYISESTGTTLYSFLFAGFSYTIAFGLSFFITLKLFLNKKKSNKELKAEEVME